MKQISKLLSSLGLALLLGIPLTGCMSGPSNPSAQLTKRIESARTADDHESLAKYYDGQAVAAKAKANKYRKLAKSASPHPTGGRINSEPITRWNSIISTFDSEAAEYEKLAAKHRTAGCNIAQSKTCG